MSNIPSQLMAKQVALNLKLAFEQVGFDQVDVEIVKVAHRLLLERGLIGIDSSVEVPITSILIQEPKQGLLSFAKAMTLSRHRVKLEWIGTKDENEWKWSCKDGLLLFTNTRLIVLIGDSRAQQYSSATNFTYSHMGIKSAGYNNNRLLIESEDFFDFVMEFDFPGASPLFEFASVGLGDKSESDYLSTAKSRQSVEEYKTKGINAKELVQRFFMQLIEVQSAEISAEVSTETSAEITDLIRKLQELKDAGILSEVEFNSKKQELLRRI